MSQADRWREWEARLADYRASGLSKVKWCKDHGVNVKQLYYWLNRFRDAEAHPEMPAQWAQVTVAEPGVPAAALAVRVGNAVIEVRSGFDPELLTNVVRALQAC